jgi:hypothetical protein
VDPDSPQSNKLDPELDPEPHQFADDKPNILNISLFWHFSNGLSLYSDPYQIKIRIRIRIRAISRIRIRMLIRIKMMRIHNAGFYQGA